MKKIVSLICFLAYLGAMILALGWSAGIVHAQTWPAEVGTIDFPRTDKFSDLLSFINYFKGWLLVLMNSLAVLALIYSGIMYITSAGDPARAEQAKKNLTWAVIGIIIVALASVIVLLVGNIFTTTPTP